MPRLTMVCVLAVAAVLFGGGPAGAAAPVIPFSAATAHVSSVAPAVRHEWRPGEPQFRPPARTPDVMGVNYHGMWEDMTPAVRAGVLDRMRAAGVRWVRLDVAWETLQPDGPGRYDLNWGVPRVDARIREIAARGMRVLLLLYWPPEWSSGTTAKNGVPRDPEPFARAAAWAAQRWRHAVGAIEVWNEPDLSEYLANTSVATYTALVRSTYRRVKAVSPGTTIVAGAPTYLGLDWYRRFLELGGAGHYDALGIHPYIGRSDASPDLCPTGWERFHPCGIPRLLHLMRAAGDRTPRLWATEYGWSVHPNPPGEPVWRRGVTPQQQAKYLLRMQEYLARWPEVRAGFWYNDRDTARSDPHEDGYGLLRRDLSPKPAWFALRCAAARICGPTSAATGGVVATATRTRWARARVTLQVRRDGRRLRAVGTARKSATATRSATGAQLAAARRAAVRLAGRVARAGARSRATDAARREARQRALRIGPA